MAAYDVDVTDFGITGNIGADGDGNVELSKAEITIMEISEPKEFLDKYNLKFIK